MAQYNHTAIESKWRENWEKNPINVNDGKKEKFQKADTDKDGYISVQEYIKMMVSNYEETIKELEAI